MAIWYFEDLELGEQFFVEADTVEEANATAKEYFPKPLRISQVTETFAEQMGLDTY